MRCPNCDNDIKVVLGTKLASKGAKVLTTLTTVITLQCAKCGKVFQVPLQSKNFLSIKEDKS